MFPLSAAPLQYGVLGGSRPTEIQGTCPQPGTMEARSSALGLCNLTLAYPSCPSYCSGYSVSLSSSATRSALRSSATRLSDTPASPHRASASRCGTPCLCTHRRHILQLLLFTPKAPRWRWPSAHTQHCQAGTPSLLWRLFCSSTLMGSQKILFLQNTRNRAFLVVYLGSGCPDVLAVAHAEDSVNHRKAQAISCRASAQALIMQTRIRMQRFEWMVAWWRACAGRRERWTRRGRPPVAPPSPPGCPRASLPSALHKCAL